MAPFVPQRIRTCHGTISQPDLFTLTELIESGKITPVIDRTYPFDQVPETIRYLEQGHARGRSSSPGKTHPAATPAR
jgi:NADPH:quinone reductase-like Zn-dependent oxidoreductase